MPYKSKAQQRFFHAAAKKGDISPDKVAEWDKASHGKKLPERVGPKKEKPIRSVEDLRARLKSRFIK